MKSRFFLLLCVLFLIFSCKKKNVQEFDEDFLWRQCPTEEFAQQVGEEIRAAEERAIDEYIENLSLQERLAQLFVINLEGKEKFWWVEYTEENGKKRPLIPGGYIFFGFNIAREPETIAAFTDSVKQFAYENNYIEPFLCLDVEGGFVNRLRGIAGELPECRRVAQCLSVEQAQELYSLNAKQLMALGFNLNLAPVAEVVTEKNENFLDGRSFGNAKQTAEYSAAAIRAYKNFGSAKRVGAVVKHFPGNNDVDPHAALPRLFYTQDELQETVLNPFKEVLKEKPAGVLMSHALVEVEGGEQPQGSELIPAGLNSYWIDTVLRGQLGYQGIVFSDDIFMAALEQNGFPPEKAVHSAILAGVNCILMSEKRFINEYNIVKKLYETDNEFRARADDSIRRVIKFKIDCDILRIYGEGKGGVDGVASLRELILKGDPHFFEKNIKDDIKKFYEAREKNSELYQKYFAATADEDELRAVKVEK